VQTDETAADGASSGVAAMLPATPDEMRAAVQRALTAGLADPGLWHASLAAPDGNAPSTALAARWAQLALLGPLVSAPEQSLTGGSDAVGAVVQAVVQAYSALRYRLLPYFLHCAHETADSGLPMLRPLLLEHSWDADAVEIDDQLMLGRDLLLAPIFSDSEEPVTRRVYLPGYANWYDWWTGALYDGRQWIETTVPLGRLPLYVRAGTAIPLADPREAGSLADDTVEVTRLLLFAPKDGAIGANIDLADDEMMGVEQERGERKARLYLEGIPGTVRDLEIVGLSASATLVDASAPTIALEPSDGLLPGQGASWASLTIRLDQGAFTAGLELSW
jgi:alpha-glucosidase (family GH31 glycosyl hydrolase)